MKEVLLTILAILIIIMIWFIVIALIIAGILLSSKFKKYKNKHIYENLEYLENYIKHDYRRCTIHDVHYYLFYNKHSTKESVNGIVKHSTLYENIHILAEIINNGKLEDCEFCKIADIFIEE